MPNPTPAPTADYLYFFKDFHWPLPVGSLTYHAGYKIAVDLPDAAEAAILADAAIPVEPDWEEPSAAPDGEIEEAE